MDLLEAIISNKANLITNLIKNRLGEMVQLKLEEKKTEIAGIMFGNHDFDDLEEDLDENFRGVNLGRERRVQYRFRRGKFQANAYRSNTSTPGYAVRSHHMVSRMTPTEIQKRRLQMRYNKYKRKNKIMRTLQKRHISVNRRKAMGLQ